MDKKEQQKTREKNEQKYKEEEKEKGEVVEGEDDYDGDEEEENDDECEWDEEGKNEEEMQSRIPTLRLRGPTKFENVTFETINCFIEKKKTKEINFEKAIRTVLKEISKFKFKRSC